MAAAAEAATLPPRRARGLAAALGAAPLQQSQEQEGHAAPVASSDGSAHERYDAYRKRPASEETLSINSSCKIQVGQSAKR